MSHGSIRISAIPLDRNGLRDKIQADLPSPARVRRNSWAVKLIRRFALPLAITVGLHTALFCWPNASHPQLGSRLVRSNVEQSKLTEIQFAPLESDSEAAATPSNQGGSSAHELPDVATLAPDLASLFETAPPSVKLDISAGTTNSLALASEWALSGAYSPQNDFNRLLAHSANEGRALGTLTPEPAYPETARREGRQGTVELIVAMAPDGRPIGVEIARSSGSPDLDAAACSTVRHRWRFQPSRDATARNCTVKIAFQLSRA